MNMMLLMIVAALLSFSGWASGTNPGVVDLGGGVKIDMVWIPPGSFTMGADGSVDNEKPRHTVRFEQGFWIGKYEVTQEQWERVMQTNPASFKGAKNPVEQVSWKDCQEFLLRINRQLAATVPRLLYHLPSEAEWEYACRAGSTTAFHFGESLNSRLANFDGKYPAGNGEKGEDRQKTVQVGAFEPNEWGLYDLYGNVWEWCADYYHENYSGAPVDGSAWLVPDGMFRMVRGGAWNSTADCCLSAHRYWVVSTARRNFIGLRIVGIQY